VTLENVILEWRTLPVRRLIIQQVSFAGRHDVQRKGKEIKK